jgi:hypothetical protein
VTFQAPATHNSVLPSGQELRKRLQSQYGDLSKHGWRVRLKWRFGYISHELWYEAVVDRLVTNENNLLGVYEREVLTKSK